MGVMTGDNTAGRDFEVETKALSGQLQDKGYLLTSAEDVINWARTGSLHWMTFGLACCAVEFYGSRLSSDKFCWKVFSELIVDRFLGFTLF